MSSVELISVFSTLATAFAIFAGIFFVMRYLQRGDLSSRFSISELQKEFTALHYSNSELQEQLENLKGTQSLLDDEGRQNIIEELKSQLNTQAAQEMLTDIQSRLAESNAHKERIEVVESQFGSTIGRLKEELFALSKRGNLNLAIGIVTTITGLVFLGVFVLTDTGPTQDASQFVVNFLPRISLVVFIEVFAYFFLRLYKSSLSEIKYFQNEITSIESKYLALKVAINAGDSGNIQNILDQLSRTERNFTLEKGQSTVDLERSKIDQQATSDILGKLTQLMGKNS